MVFLAFICMPGSAGRPSSHQLQSRKADSGFAPSSKQFRYQTLIERKSRLLKVFDENRVLVFQTPVGIGRGGLKKKTSMQDYVTPKGEFVVDLILYKKASYNSISKAARTSQENKPGAKGLLGSKEQLAGLLSNMNSLDFDGDGASDTAYGDGYIGLNSEAAVCGPKLSKFRGVPYWYSIALHGTADEKANIGACKSGGCVQVPASALKEIIEKAYLRLGSSVSIK